MPKDFKGPNMVFLVGGYDPGTPYGRVFEFAIPGMPKPKEHHAGGEFGLVWGGQKDFTDRIMQGFDDALPGALQEHLNLTDDQRNKVREYLRGELMVKIPYEFLPLQDCVDLSIFLIRTTVNIQNWIVGVRGVGGAVDVATITRVEGFKPVQQKTIVGERRQ